ncbi:MAG: hypothetical protein RLZZ77_750 [Bacteroidota bacterium]
MNETLKSPFPYQATMNAKAIILLVIVALCSFTIEAIAQQPTLYLDKGLQRTKQEMSVYEIPLTAGQENVWVAEVKIDDKIKMSGEYIAYENTFIENGLFTFYFDNGVVESTGFYERGARIGTWKRYDEAGNAKADRFYTLEGAHNVRVALGIDQVVVSK